MYLFYGDVIKSLIKKDTIFTSVPMKAHMIPIYLSEWVEPYGLTQYIIFITNINIHMCSLLGEVAGGSLQSKIFRPVTIHYSPYFMWQWKHLLIGPKQCHIFATFIFSFNTKTKTKQKKAYNIPLWFHKYTSYWEEF